MSAHRNNKINTVTILVVLYGFEAICANLAHPITPNLMSYRNMPSSMFGIVFAAMAFTNFLFSPFWGVLCKHIPARVILMICCIGYGLGQAIFGFGDTRFLMILGRLISGAFVSGVTVASTYYVVIKSGMEMRTRNITLTMTAFTVMGTFGFLIGGVIGTSNMFVAIYAQVIGLCAVGVLFYFLLEGNDLEQFLSARQFFVSSNPIASFISSKAIFTKKTTAFFLLVFLASFAATSMSQSIMYYLQTELGYAPYINGTVKGIVGFVAIFANFKITNRILRNKGVEKRQAGLYLAGGLLYGLMILTKDMPLTFIITCIVIMSIDAMMTSILQDRTVTYSSLDNRGEMLGMQNASKAIGMIVGAIVSSKVYEFNTMYPFLVSGFLCIVCVFISLSLNKGGLKNERSTEIAFIEER